MVSTQSSAPSDKLVDALTLLRDSALLMIIAELLVSIGLMAMFLMIFGVAITTPIHPRPPPHPMALGLLAIVLIIAISIAGAVLTLYALFGKLIPSSTKFTEYDPDFSTSATLIKIGLMICLLYTSPSPRDRG